MLFDPKIKPRLWNLKTGIVVHNCARMKLPVPKAIYVWGGGSQWPDLSGNRNDGTYYNPEWTIGAAKTDSDSYISVPTNPSIVGFSAITIVIFAKPTSDGEVNTSYAVSKSNGTNQDYSIGQTKASQGNKIIFRFHDGTAERYVQNSVAWTVGSWNYIVCTWKSGDSGRIYKKGILEHTEGPYAGTAIQDSGEALGIGRNIAESTGRKFNGLIDHVILFDKQLSSFQVQTIYNNFYGMVEPIRDYRIWSFISGGETFYKTITGNQPASTGSVVTIGIYKQVIAGSVPNPVASIVKKISTLITGDVPAPTAIILKKTSKQFVGEQPATTGNVTAVSVYKQSATGDIPAATGSLDSVFQIGQTITGNMPSSFGNAIKRIGKMLSGNFPTTVGNIAKQTEKNVAGDMPSAAGSISHTTKTFLSGVMGNITGIVSTILNPIPSAVFKLCKLIGSCFKKFLG